MYSYFGYGLNIHSVLPLPELLPANCARPDVVIRTGEVQYPIPKRGNGREYCSMTSQEAYLFWEDFGTFLVRGGSEIIIDPRTDIEERVVRLPLLGAGMAVLLHQRGLYVMHASAIAISEEAISFLGPKGHGKSSLAAAFFAQGHRLLADDLVAIDLSDPKSPFVVPGFPQFKLWPETAETVLEDDLAKLPFLAPGYEKRGRRATEGFRSEKVRLRRLYIIGEAAQMEMTLLTPQQAIADLIGNSYIARFGRNALHGESAAMHLQQAATLVNNIPVFSLKRPNSLALLPSVVENVINHSAELELVH